MEITKEQVLHLSNKFGNDNENRLRSNLTGVLKEWFPEAFEVKLETGKWYKCIEKGFESLVCITDFENCKAYGFIYYGKNDKNIWVENDNRGWSFKSDAKNWVSAANEEVFEALKKEAVRIGIKIGVAINRDFDDTLGFALIDTVSFKHDSEWYYDSKDDYLEHHGFVVCSKGRFAKIAETTSFKEAEKLLNKKIV